MGTEAKQKKKSKKNKAADEPVALDEIDYVAARSTFDRAFKPPPVAESSRFIDVDHGGYQDAPVPVVQPDHLTAIANSTFIGDINEPLPGYTLENDTGESGAENSSQPSSKQMNKKKGKILNGRTARAFNSLLSRKGEHETGESGAETDVVENGEQPIAPADDGKFVEMRKNSKRSKAHQQQRTSHVFKSSDLIRCKVYLLDDQFRDFVVHRKSTGRELSESVCDFLNLAERDYFGLRYLHETGIYFWLDAEKEIRKQMESAQLKHAWELEFAVKFYPPEPSFMQEELTRYLLCLQVRRDITSPHGGLRNCSFVTLTLLGSYVAQSELGDYEPDFENTVRSMRFCARQDPRSIEYQANPEESRMMIAELQDRIIELYKTHVGIRPHEADYRYLENAKRLEFYGIEFTDALDASGMAIRVGVFYNGVVVYRDRVRISRFAWPKVLKLSYHGPDFKLRVRPEFDARAGSKTLIEETVVLRLRDARVAKRLWKVCVEQHTFYRKKGNELLRKKPAVTSRIGTLVNGFGSSRFQYSGRTLYQYRSSSARHDPPPPVNRTSQIGQARSLSTLGRDRDFSMASSGLKRPGPATSVSARDVRQQPSAEVSEPAVVPRIAKRRAPDPVPDEKENNANSVSAPSWPLPPKPAMSPVEQQNGIPMPLSSKLDAQPTYYEPPEPIENLGNLGNDQDSSFKPTNRDSQPPPLPANGPPAVVPLSGEAVIDMSRPRDDIIVGSARPRRFSVEQPNAAAKPAVPPKTFR